MVQRVEGLALILFQVFGKVKDGFFGVGIADFVGDAFDKVGVGHEATLVLFELLFSCRGLIDFALQFLTALLIGVELVHFGNEGEGDADDGDQDENAETDAVDDVPI